MWGIVGILSMVGMLGLCISVLYGYLAYRRAAFVASNPQLQVTASKETTVFTGPLRDDGSVDYIAAVNERWSDGITVENNAAVLFRQAMGPDSIPEGQREKYFQLLGIPPLQAEGNYFVSFDEFINRDGLSAPEQESAQMALGQALSRPWSNQEFPLLARWLKANEAPLELLVNASKRPRFYNPLVEKHNSFNFALGIYSAEYRAASRALIARAQLRIQMGQLADAWNDLQASHRLARLVSSSPSMTDYLTAGVMEHMSCEGDVSYLRHCSHSAERWAQLASQLRDLPPLASPVHIIDDSERIVFLDSVCRTAHKGFQFLNGDEDENMVEPETPEQRAARAAINWDLILTDGNAFYDRLVAAMQKDTRVEKDLELERCEQEIGERAKRCKDVAIWLKTTVIGDREMVSEQLGNFFICMIAPATAAVSNFADQSQMRTDITKLGFFLAAFHAEKGTYPVSLAELAPRYVVTIPLDVFSGSDLRYTQLPDGYLLYSIGKNKKDDGGRTAKNAQPGEEVDDIVVQLGALNTQ